MSLPIPLGRALRRDELIETEWCDSLLFLGSYWAGAYDAQSQIVKYFKEPEESKVPLKPALAYAYAKLIAEAAGAEAPDAIVRVLGSSETKPDPNRPLALLTAQLSKTLGIPDRSYLFFRSDTREPMRYVDRLSGPEALRQRLNYVLQDLFIRPSSVGRRVLLIDDIYNLGASVRVYSAALKSFCGVERVIAVNLAAARFGGGRDGLGKLHLDLANFAALGRPGLTRAQRKAWHGENSFQIGWVGRDGKLFHALRECPTLGPEKARKTLLFLQGKDGEMCAECSKNTGWWRSVIQLINR